MNVNDYFKNDQYWSKHINKYLEYFNIIKIDERETIRFEHKKNYIVFIVKK